MTNNNFLVLNTTSIEKLLFSKDNLLLKSYEYSGKIIFSEKKSCNSNGCYKYQKDIITIKGSKSSAYVPRACVNFHTHPVSCYKDSEVIWGWPSGEDLRVVLEQRCNNLCHLVFAIEGTYILNSNKDIVYGLTAKEINDIEKMFIETHEYRCIDDYENAHKKFKKNFPQLTKLKTTNTLQLWLYLVNNMTITKNRKKYNVLFVDFIPNKTFHFNLSPEKCYEKIKGLNSKNIRSLVKFTEDIIIKI